MAKSENSKGDGAYEILLKKIQEFHKLIGKHEKLMEAIGRL